MVAIGAIVIAELDALLTEYAQASNNGRYDLDHTPVDASALRTRVAAAIDRAAPRSSRYVEDANEAVANPGDYGTKKLIGVARALRDDYAAGYMTSIEELIHADLFADFLEMAEELLSKAYKDAAAVIAGSVLEEHQRKLAVANGLSIRVGTAHKKADTINADLVKAGVCSKLEQKSVTAWLGLRNAAAHGDYGNYDAAQVNALIRDVRGFMVRHPA